MTIGVDAGMLGITDDRLKVGVWRVAVNLLRELAALDKTNTYRLYSFTPIPSDILLDFGSRMESRVIGPRLGWFSLRLPFELRAHPPDLFLGLAQAVPAWRGRSIGFIYDLGFLRFPQYYPGTAAKLSRQTTSLIQRSDTLVTTSEASKKDIKSSFDVAEKNIVVCYPGIEPIFYKKNPVPPKGEPYFLFVGSLKRTKNVATLLRAFAQFLKESKTKIKLLLAGGDFWPDPAIDRAIRDLDLENYVRKLGFVPDLELARLYAGALVLVVPSFVEGFCLPAAEAMAAGTPVIGSTSAAIPEIVGDAGIFLPADDVPGFAAAFTHIASSPHLRESLSRNARLRAKRFSWEKFTQKVLSLYET